MNRLFITAVAVLTLAGSAAADAPRYRGHRAEQMARRLNLTDAQRQQLREMHKSFRAENQAFFESWRQASHDFREAKAAGDTAKMESLKPTLEANRAHMDELRNAFDRRIATVLTPEQFAQWNEMKSERSARHQRRRR